MPSSLVTKVIFISLFALSPVFASHARAEIQELGINYTGQAELSEVTVIHNGSKKIYDVAPEAAADLSLGPGGTALGLGRLTVCSPYIGDTDRELRIRVNVTKRVRDNGGRRFRAIEISAGEPGRATFIVPAGARVHGNCGGEDGGDDTLYEVTFEANDTNPIRVDMD